jgi:hypothetical protein
MPHDGLFISAPEPQGIASPARYAKGTAAYEAELLALAAEVETWRGLAEERGRHLDGLMAALAQVRLELQAFPERLVAEIEGHLARRAAEHDRS